MEDKMIERINREIEISKKYFELTGQTDIQTNCKIIGMLQMLEIATGKEYYFDENGLHER
jgi:hypothetical protein